LSPVVVDARGLLCPLPVIRVQDRIAQLAAGTLVEALSSDPGALSDIPAWCRINGHRVLESCKRGPDYLVVIEVGQG